MPILPREVIGTWYFMKQGENIQIVENYSQNKIEELNPKPYVQGDIGTRVMAVGGIYYEYEFSADALILLNPIANLNASDITGTIKSAFDYLKRGGFYNNTEAPYLLENARISISKNGITASSKYISDSPSTWIAAYGPNDSTLNSLVARTAQWYDCTLTFDTTTSNGESAYQIENAVFNIQSSIGRRYFIGQTQTPKFSVDSYTVSGEITFLIAPTGFDSDIFQILTQSSGTLTINGLKSMIFKIAGVPILTFGADTMISSVRANIRAGQITTATLAFTSYSNYSTTL